MKQLVEAAYDYATQKTNFRKEVLKEVEGDYSDLNGVCINSFNYQDIEEKFNS